MNLPVFDPLDDALRALREIQAPEQITPSTDSPSGYRVSSAAFKPGTDGSISVDLEEMMALDGVEVTAKFPSLPRAVGLVAHEICTIRKHGAEVSHVPLLENPYHGEIRMPGLSKSQIRKAARSLAETCEILVGIDADEASKHGKGEASAPA